MFHAPATSSASGARCGADRPQLYNLSMTYLRIAAVTLTILCLATAVLAPLVYQPFTYTLWLAFDLATHQPDARELAEADAAVAAPSVA